MRFNKTYMLLLPALVLSSFSLIAETKTAEERIIFANEIWEKNQSNYLAQFYIAEQHFKKMNYNDALTWYLKSATQGFEPAIQNTQILIKEDLGTEPNMDRIVTFLTDQGLNKNNLFAQMYLGDIYRNGQYEIDYEKSFFWYTKASEQGELRADFYLGNMLLTGVGTVQNVPRGIRILEKVADKDHSGAIYNIGKVFKMGYNIKQNHIFATEWFKRGAHLGNVDSMFEYADSLEKGFGVMKDPKQSIFWFENAAMQGHVEAAFRAGLSHLFLSVLNEKEFTVEQGVKWLDMSANSGFIDAQLRLGDIYYEGRHNVDKNYVLAEKYYSMAAAQNEQIAYKKLSFIYRMGGYGVERDDVKYKDNMEKYYSYKKEKISVESQKLNLFNYNIFKF